jgi:predicted dehydrogenase
LIIVKKNDTIGAFWFEDILRVHMHKINTAIVGAGYLGRYHAEKLATLTQSRLVAVCDADFERCREIAEKHSVQAISDYKALIGQVDAVNIAVPTHLHYSVGKFFLENGVHVLLEKPIATTLEQANELIAIAKHNHVLLQIGHLERFNSVVKALNPILKNPLFIESVRLAPFKLRGSDVNVICDVMIHDIDIIQSLVKSKIKHIHANGAPVLSSDIDIANARLEFENGCVANVSASRVSLKTERKLRIFQHDCYIGLDLDQKKMSIHRKGPGELFTGLSEIVSENHHLESSDALKDEIAAFLNAIIEEKPVVVSGEDGKQALETALEITHKIQNQLQLLKEKNLSF